MTLMLDKKHFIIWGGLLLLITMMFTVGTYYNHDIIGGMIALELSDTMYLPTLFKDLVLENGRYTDWYLAPAPYFFPDIFLYFISGFINNDYYHSNLIFILFQKTVLFVAIYCIFSSFYSKHVAFLLASILLVIFYMVPTSFSTFLIKGNWHFGVTLVGLLIVSLLLKSIGSSNNLLRFILIFVFSALCIASDKLFILQFLVPIIFTMTVMLAYKKIDSIYWLKVTTLLCMSVVFGYLIYDIVMFNKTAYSVKYSFDHIYPNLIDLGVKYTQYIKSNPVFVTVNTGFVLVIMWQSMKMLLIKKNDSSSRLFFIMILCLVSIPLIIGVLLISSLEIANRYLIPINFLPTIVMVVFINSTNWNAIKLDKKPYALLAVILTVLPTVGWTYFKLKSFEFKNEYYPKHFQCVDQFLAGNKADVGVGNYWVSKRFAMINKLGFKVVNVGKNLNIINRISTAGWISDNYDFVISNTRWKNNPDISLITKRNNSANYTHKKCGFIEVFHFANGFKLK